MMDNEGLEGIRVLEVAGGVGEAYVAKLFGDLGADVIRVEGDGDVVRSRPHDVHRWLDANKRSVTSGFEELVVGADIVVQGRGLSYEALTALSPRVVLCSVTPFGLTGPYAGMAAEELTLIHGSSWGFLSPGAASDPNLPPLKAPGHHATIMVAHVAATAALAAFDRAERSGRGEHVDFSLFAAAARMTETTPAAASFLGVDASRLGVKTLLPWNIYECADGLVQIICTDQTQWQAFVHVMGDPEWAGLEVFADNAARQNSVDILDLYIGEWTSMRTVDEIVGVCQAGRICASPVNTMAQLAADPHLTARRFFATAPDGVKVPGAGFQVDQPWWRLRLPAAEPGEHDGEGWMEAPRSTASATRLPGRPLDGVRVCDFTWIWAGPFATQQLAHLGADVIRLESPEHLCMMRWLPFNPPGTELGPDTAGMFQVYNSDKRSVGIDLRRDEARDIVRRLVEISDVVIDNFGVGVMDSLGFGVDDLRAINPDIIVASLSGYGQTGPSASYMAYGPSGGAVAGLYASNGYEGAAAAETGIAVGDPGTGMTAAWAVTAALVARRRTGVAARIDVAMVEAVAATVGELWMEYSATGLTPPRRANRDPVWAPHGCYPAQGADRWVTIACPSEQAWQALCDVINPSLADNGRFRTAELRKANEDDLDAVIAKWTSARDRWEVSRALQAAGVASMPSLSPMDLWHGDPQLDALGMLEQPDHPVTGVHIVPGIPWRLANGPNGLRRAAPTLGQHTREVLVDLLGFAPDEVDRMADSGALYGAP